MTNNKFSSEKLAWYVQYEEIRQLGIYNMLAQASLAMKVAGLTETQYMFVLKHYSELKEQYKSMKLQFNY